MRSTLLCSPRVVRCCASLALVFVGARDATAQRRTTAGVVAPLSYVRTVLPNGLVAIVNEDHTAPVVTVDVWYHIGGKNDPNGRHGLAHLCEHLMGEGSPNESQPQKIFVQSIGGVSANWGVTSEDMTHYFATVPSVQLETMLWLESDRMATPLSRADGSHVASVRDVIKQERHQRVDTPVYGLSDPLTVAGVFPNGHPYGADPIGLPSDLDAATADEAKAFCLPYYVPNNAVISISGDVSASRTITLIQKYFSSIPRGSSPHAPPVSASSLAAPVREVLEDQRGRNAQLRFAWPSVGFVHPDRVALAALASVLSRDRLGRLSKALVYDLGLATRVTATNFDFEQGGVFQIDIAAKPAASLTRVEQVVDSIIASLATTPPTKDEIEAFANTNAFLAVATLQTRAARADTLAHGEVFAHDPVSYAKQVNRAFALTPSDVQRVAKTHLTAARLVMSMVPAGKLDQIAKPELPYTNVTPRTSAGAGSGARP